MPGSFRSCPSARSLARSFTHARTHVHTHVGPPRLLRSTRQRCAGVLDKLDEPCVSTGLLHHVRGMIRTKKKLKNRCTKIITPPSFLVGCSWMQLTLHATRRTPHGASRLVHMQCLPGPSKPDVLRPGIVGMQGSCGDTTTAMHDMSAPHPSPPLGQGSDATPRTKALVMNVVCHGMGSSVR